MMAKRTLDFTKLSHQLLKEFNNRYDAYIFDMDETLISISGAPIEGVEEALNEIERNGKSIIVFTDNCLAPLNNIREKLNNIYPAIKKENIMNSGRLVATYLKEINFKKKLYVIGDENGMIKDLKEFGFDVLYDHEMKKITVLDLRETKFEEGVGAVVVASDTNFNYFKMFKAVNYLRDPDVLLIQTHIPVAVAYNPILPAVGALLAPVKAASGRTETIAMGKGSDYCSKYLKSLGFPAKRCLFVGDGIANDVVAGNLADMDTMLVLTGVSSLENIENAMAKNIQNQIPTYYTNSVADLIKIFKTER